MLEISDEVARDVGEAVIEYVRQSAAGKDAGNSSPIAGLEFSREVSGPLARMLAKRGVNTAALGRRCLLYLDSLRAEAEAIAQVRGTGARVVAARHLPDGRYAVIDETTKRVVTSLTKQQFLNGPLPDLDALGSPLVYVEEILGEDILFPDVVHGAAWDPLVIGVLVASEISVPDACAVLDRYGL